MPRPKPFIEEEAGKLITAENNNQKQIRTIEGILFHKHGGGVTDEFPNHDDFENYEDYLAEIAKVGPKVSGDGIEDMTITMEKLAQNLQDTIRAGAVEEDEIKSKMIDDADGTTGQNTTMGSGIKTPHIQDDAVATEKIADVAVTTEKIADEAVTMDKLNTVVKDAISAGAVEEDEIKSKMIDDADGSTGQDTTTGSGIKTPHIQDEAVTTGKIADDAVATEKIANEAVTMDKLHADVQNAISAGAVGEDEIKSKMIDDADGSTGQDTTIGSGIKTPHIQDEAVTTGKIADGAVTMNKLHTDVQDAISAGAVGEDEIKSEMIDDADGSTGQDTTAGSGIKTPHIQDNAITTGKIADGAVITNKISNNAVVTTKIANDAVTQEKVKENSISIQELRTKLITSGTLSLNPGGDSSVKLGASESGFFLPSVIITSVFGGPMGVTWAIRCGSNRQHWLHISNPSNFPAAVSYKVYEIVESQRSRQ